MARDPYAVRLGRIKDAVEQQRTDRRREEAHSATGQTRRRFMALQKFWLQVFNGSVWIWNNILSPPRRHVWRFIKWIAHTYRRLIWDRYVYKADEFGVRQFYEMRAGIVMLATVAFVYFALPVIWIFVWDAGQYAFTARVNETIYLTKSQDIDPLGNEHSVTGFHAIPSDPENSIYFRVNSTLFNQLWSLLHHSWRHGPPFFFPDNVAAAVPPGTSICVATSYGIRVKLFMRGMDWYPDLLTASCRPVAQK